VETTYKRPVRDAHGNIYGAHNQALVELAERNPRIVTSYADFPAGEAGEAFRARFPDRMVDVGIAEAHLITSAAGLADAGFIPFTHCHCLFALGRGYNQIRQNVAYDDRNVKIVLCNAGALWGDIGPSHVSVEDIAALRAVPNLVLLAPSDPVSCRKATFAAAEHRGPVIMRLPFIGGSYPLIYTEELPFEIGKAFELTDGGDLSIVSTGILLNDVLEAVEQLGEIGIQARVIDCQTIKPLDEEVILRAARETAAILTVEDGSTLGGLGGAVAELVAERQPVPVRRIGLQDVFGESGKAEEIKAHYGLNAEAIARAGREILRRKG
jgi:transketolase